MSASAAAHPDIEKVLLSEADIDKRVRELGRQIAREYAGRKPVFVGILKGSFVFLSDLLRAAQIECTVDFICLASYSGAASTGVVRMMLDLRESPQGRDLVIVEDVVDTGLTLSYLLENLRTRGPRSVEVCALLDKPSCRRAPVQPKYVGFPIPDEFVVGYGLDCDERYRYLPYIGVLKASAA